jgi:hypothetical protein
MIETHKIYIDYVITMTSTSSSYVSKTSVSTLFTSIIHINPRCHPLVGISATGCCSWVPAIALASASPQSGIRAAIRTIEKGSGSRAAMHFIRKGGDCRAASGRAPRHVRLPGWCSGRRGTDVATAAAKVRDGSGMGTMRRKLLHARSGSTVAVDHGGAGAVMMRWWIPDDPGCGSKTLAQTG